MKSDIDRLMAERCIDALLITGGVYNNPAMYYMSNGARLGEATILVKKRGEGAVIIANSMERDEAAKSGLRVIDRNHFNPDKILNEEKGNWLRRQSRLYSAILDELGVQGRVSVYGREEHGAALAQWRDFAAVRPDIEIVGEFQDTIFEQAWRTKDEDEIARIRAVGEKTMRVVGRTWEFLASHKSGEGVLVKADGSSLTIGDVKKQINRWIAEQGLEDPEGVIFAIGRDAAVPHSHGEDGDPIALGKTIIFDIFPREAGGGYYFDFTRTWCVGYAPPEVEKTYHEVLEIFNLVADSLEAGGKCAEYQRMTNDFFEARGHPTSRSNPQTTEGYVHGLGHGVGLNIHEGPFFRDYVGATDTLQPGAAITVEPGLYYPAKGFGVRIEDFLWLNPKTKAFETIGEFKKDLVIPIKSQMPTPKSQKKKRTKYDSHPRHRDLLR